MIQLNVNRMTCPTCNGLEMFLINYTPEVGCRMETLKRCGNIDNTNGSSSPNKVWKMISVHLCEEYHSICWRGKKTEHSVQIINQWFRICIYIRKLRSNITAMEILIFWPIWFPYVYWSDRATLNINKTYYIWWQKEARIY